MLHNVYISGCEINTGNSWARASNYMLYYNNYFFILKQSVFYDIHIITCRSVVNTDDEFEKVIYIGRHSAARLDRGFQTRPC